MRAFLILLTAVVTLLASASGSASNQQATQGLIQPVNAAKPETAQGRMLLRAVDDEERGAKEIIKELGKSAKKATKDSLHKIYVKANLGLENPVLIDKTAEKFVRKSFNPNQVYKWMHLDESVSYTGPNWRLYFAYVAKYMKKHPDWKPEPQIWSRFFF